MTNIANERFWQIAVLTAAGTMGAGSQADAALFYWQDSDPTYYYRPEPMPQPRRQKVRRPAVGKNAAPEKEAGAKPRGPLVIAISVQHQKVRIYDANGLFAESPVSTGMPGHSTPMGVFSVIQKHKFHQSNIYSGAPMPYMQRITWSGIAMHAGVLPGYPASHGCIRMPMAFAVKMWNWTKMGARVIVTPGEMTPAAFSHPLLVTQKVDAPLGVKGDKGADAGPAAKATDQAKLDLRSTVGRAETPLRAQTQTADATGADNSSTMSDASPAAARTGDSKPSTVDTPSKADQASNTEAKPEATTPETESAQTNSSETASSDAKPADAAAESIKAEEKPVGAKAAEIKTKAPKTETAKTETAKIENKTEPQAGAPKAAESKTAEKASDAVKAATDATASTLDAKKDPARLSGVAKSEPPKRTGQIAVLISRKDSKLYVRQNFSPLFEVPVTIAPSDRPLGTHVFTAEVDRADANKLHWSVVTLPASRNAMRNDDEVRSSRRRKMAGIPAEVKALPLPDSPAEALDRIAIPPDAMTRIAEALTTGSSIIISDQGINQGETGEGTDFIVPLR